MQRKKNGQKVSNIHTFKNIHQLSHIEDFKHPKEVMQRNCYMYKLGTRYLHDKLPVWFHKDAERLT